MVFDVLHLNTAWNSESEKELFFSILYFLAIHYVQCMGHKSWLSYMQQKSSINELRFSHPMS